MYIKKWRVYHAMNKVARKRGITLEQVVWDIDDAIHEAYTTALKEANQAVLAAWREIPCKGPVPSAVELVSYLAEKISE